MREANDKIFDSAFRTMLEKMPQLMIPLINEAFHTHYTAEDLKLQLKNEHVDVVGGMNRSTDSLLYVGDKRYHLECQKNPDSTMAIRMFEYDVAIALQSSRELHSGGNYEIVFPESCVLYLTHNKSIGDTVSIPVRFSDGYVHQYKVPVVKAQSYSSDDIFSKKLHVLLPYYILRYEKLLKNPSYDNNLQQRLLNEYGKIAKQLHEAVDAEVYTNLIQIMNKVLDYELQDDPKLKGAMNMIMNAEVWELQTEKMERLARETGQHIAVDMLVRKNGMTEDAACELMEIKVEEYREYKKYREKWKKEASQEERADEMLPRKQGRKL